MADAPLALRVLHSLKALGLRLSIDDFGTGYSSLSYVNSLPVDQLKIDRSFIHGLRTGHEAPVVLAVVSLAHALDLEVVAEGLETAIRSRDCAEWDATSAKASSGAVPWCRTRWMSATCQRPGAR